MKRKTIIPKKIAVINDLSGYGRCSLSVSIPVISALGVQACPVPTSILSNHTAFPSEYKFDFTDHMEPYTGAWKQLHLSFDGILTGYMNYDEQVKHTADFIDAFKTAKTLVFVDPAMADHGRLYRGFSSSYVKEVKEFLVSKATVLKPNITEACLLTGFSYDAVMEASREHTMRRLKSMLMNMVEALSKLGPKQIIITGLDRGDRILNTVYDNGDIKFISVKKTGQSRPGTGDIFSSIVAAALIRGLSLESAVRKAADFVGNSIRISDEAGVPVNQGVIFENIMSRLTALSDQI